MAVTLERRRRNKRRKRKKSTHRDLQAHIQKKIHRHIVHTVALYPSNVRAPFFISKTRYDIRHNQHRHSQWLMRTPLGVGSL